MSVKVPDLKVGLSSSVQKQITLEDTALNYGSGALTDLLATPSLVALMIEAAVNTIDPLLPDPYITAGKTCSIAHTNPTMLGMIVTVEARLTEIDNNTLTFDIVALDELGEIGRGTFERIIVNRHKFMEKTSERCQPLKKITV